MTNIAQIHLIERGWKLSINKRSCKKFEKPNMREKAEHDVIGGEKAGKKNDIIRGKTAEFLNRKHSENPREMGTVQY
jgi:hypothetical protein